MDDASFWNGLEGDAFEVAVFPKPFQKVLGEYGLPGAAALTAEALDILVPAGGFFDPV